jgi:hypothetical protein
MATRDVKQRHFALSVSLHDYELLHVIRHWQARVPCDAPHRVAPPHMRDEITKRSDGSPPAIASAKAECEEKIVRTVRFRA